MTKYALVTGADRGLGYALVNRLLANDYHVFAGRYLEELTALNELKTRFPERLQLVRLDIGDDESVRQAGQTIAQFTDKLDIVINNAAILGDFHSSIFDALDFDGIGQVLNVNTLGPLRVVNAIVSLLMNGDEKLILNISSEVGSIGSSATPEHAYKTNWFAYCMSKTALNMQACLIHNQMKDAGGQVLLIHPGWVQTHMQGKLDEDALLTPDQSAAHIWELIVNRDKYRGDLPAYVDHEGRTLPW